MAESLRHMLETMAARTAFGTMGALPAGAARGVGAALGRTACSPFRIRRSVVTEQIAAAFPERGPEWVDRTARSCFEHFGREAAEIIRMNVHGTGDLASRTIDIETARRTLKANRDDGLGSVIVTGHLGNWEVAGAAVSLLGIPLAAVVKRQENAGFDRLVTESRRRLGIEPVYMDEAKARMPQLIREGVSVALVADQDARGRGLFVPFLGRPASTFRGPARLALQTGAPLFFGAAVREGDGYRAIVEPVDTDVGGENAQLEVTRRWVRRLDHWVRRVPEQYFWFHRRWKTTPGDVSGRPER